MKSIFESPSAHRLLRKINDQMASRGIKPIDFDEMRRTDREKWLVEQQRERRAMQKELEMKNGLGRSGIEGKYKRCTLDNYKISLDENGSPKHQSQINVINFARWYTSEDTVNTKYLDCRNFVFSGKSRTGKNHIASAICNTYLASGHTAVITTLSEVKLKLEEFQKLDKPKRPYLEELIECDVLVFDEVGVAKLTDSLIDTLNYVIDKRCIYERRTAVLSNLSFDKMFSDENLGVRIKNRIMESGTAFDFDWEPVTSSREW